MSQARTLRELDGSLVGTGADLMFTFTPLITPELVLSSLEPLDLLSEDAGDLLSSLLVAAAQSCQAAKLQD